MSLLELSITGARDKFGHLFRDWHVVGWEEGRVPPDYVCRLYSDWEPKSVELMKPESKQMELFA